MRWQMLIVLLLWPASLQAAASRVVSASVCADHWVLSLFERERIAGVSHYAQREEFMAYVDLAKGLAQHDGSAESIMAMQPDLVVVDMFTRRATRNMLERLHIPTVSLPSATTIEDGLAVVETLKPYMQPAQYQQLKEKIAQAISAFPMPQTQEDDSRLAVVYRPGGYSPALKTLQHDVMLRAGLRNLTGELGYYYTPSLPLEQLIDQNPAYVIEDVEVPRVHTLSELAVKHPAFKAFAADAQLLKLSLANWFCLSPKTYDAMAQLAEDVDDHEQ